MAKGTALFRIDDAELRAQVARAEADRDLAQQSYQRTRELLAQRASSQADLENAEATYRGTAASLDLLKVRLDRTTVRAPFAGIVGQRFVSVGDYVTSQSRLATLQTVDPTRAVFQVPERYADVAEDGPAHHVPGGGAAAPAVHRPGGLRGSGGAAARPHDHREGRGGQPEGASCSRACSSRCGWRRPCGPTRW